MDARVPSCRVVLGSAGCVLLLAAVILTTGHGDGPAARVRSELVAASKRETGEQVLLDGVDQVARTKKVLALRGRMLAHRIRSLARTVKEEERTLRRDGAKKSQMQDLQSDVDGIQVATTLAHAACRLPANPPALARSLSPDLSPVTPSLPSSLSPPALSHTRALILSFSLSLALSLSLSLFLSLALSLALSL